MNDAYHEFIKEDLILRDHLAVDRTALANERTFLAYIRTALAVLITGVGCIKFFDSTAIHVAGWAFVTLSVVTLLIGIKRYHDIKRQYRALLAARTAPKAGGSSPQ